MALLCNAVGGLQLRADLRMCAACACGVRVRRTRAVCELVAFACVYVFALRVASACMRVRA